MVDLVLCRPWLPTMETYGESPLMKPPENNYFFKIIVYIDLYCMEGARTSMFSTSSG